MPAAQVFHLKNPEERAMKFKFTARTAVMLGAGLALAVPLALNSREGHLLFGRYRIFYDSQTVKCLPQYTWYLVDTGNRRMERNALYSFRAKSLGIYPDGTNLIKVLKGLPGDAVKIFQQQVFINGMPAATGFPLAIESGINPEIFEKSYVIAPHRYFMLGEHFRSFDSRYWGTADETQIVGRAYPLF